MDNLKNAIASNNRQLIWQISTNVASSLRLTLQLRDISTVEEAGSFSFDELSQILIPDDVVVDTSLIAIKTTGNGNCLYNATSLGLAGNETYAENLRLLCAAEIFLNAQAYTSHEALITDDNFGMCLSANAERAFTTNQDRVKALECEALNTCTISPRPTWSNLIHLIALPNVIHRPVYSMYPSNTGFPYRHVFNRLYTPFEECNSAKPLYILWSVDGALPHENFTPNHFVFLKEGSQNSQTENHTACTTDHEETLTASHKHGDNTRRKDKTRRSTIDDFFRPKKNKPVIEDEQIQAAVDLSSNAGIIPDTQQCDSTIISTKVSSTDNLKTPLSLSSFETPHQPKEFKFRKRAFGKDKIRFSSVPATMFLARQGLPIRGADNDKDSNFYQLNNLRCQEDPKFKEWLQRKTDRYTSPEIQNEIISIMSDQVVRSLATEIRQSNFFAILADETTDISNRQQLVVCLRWIDDHLQAHEDLIDLYKVDNTQAATIAESIKDVLVGLNVNIGNCRGQTYDGASAMAGRKSGVQQRIKEIEPKALYNHCHGHLLNLACADNIKKNESLSSAMDTAYEITKLVKKSPNRDTHLEKNCKDAATDLDRPNSKKSINLKFFFGSSLAEVLLRNADNLSKTLQCKDLSAAESKSIAQKTVQTLKSLRDDECFNLFWENVIMKSRRKSVEEPVLPRKRRMPSRLETGTATAEFHSTPKDFYRQKYYQAVDHIVQAITDRFEQEDFTIYLNTEQVLLKCIKGVDFSDEFKIVCQFYKEDLHEANLQCQLRLFATIFESATPREDIVLANIITFIRGLTQRERVLLSEVVTVLKLVLVLPATNATSERSFSTLRHIKTYLRSTMKQDRLNDLMVLHVHKTRTDNLDLKSIAEEFAFKEYRKNIFGKFQ
ncbi:unnamed protein product [Mytilus edulis]|uniref:Zinc finger MYM-type protein 1 n=1 Tax=Mytilus edulis TaxID=6550 RepID=A0A8S3PSU9_MYTED|nr:unnamed protein product [Mytilus edulis]